jgi:hypothetical protein
MEAELMQPADGRWQVLLKMGPPVQVELQHR